MLQHFFPKAQVLISVGNNDVVVHDALASKSSVDLESLSDIWLKDFPDDQVASFRSGGYFSSWIDEKIKVISLNTLYFFKNNFMAENCQSCSSPGTIQLIWLESELNDIRDRGNKALIIGHIPPLEIFYHESCLDGLSSLLNIYSSIISLQTFGHIHIDDFFILKYRKIPISFALVSPALSPVFNPSYRIYELDKQDGSLVDYHQFYAPLNKEPFLYMKEYSCIDAFGKGPLSLEYFVNIKLRESKNSSLRIQRKRYRKVRY